MQLKNLWKEKNVTLSFEVFPNKKDSDFETVRATAEAIARLKPDFMSVTYGAGGGTAAADVNAGPSAFGAEDGSTAGGVLSVLSMADLEGLHIGNFDFFDHCIPQF